MLKEKIKFTQKYNYGICKQGVNAAGKLLFQQRQHGNHILCMNAMQSIKTLAVANIS